MVYSMPYLDVFRFESDCILDLTWMYFRHSLDVF